MRKNLIYLILIILFNSCQNNSIAQKVNFQPVLDSLENDFQKKLDTGERMLSTSRKYRLESDSLLNVIYNKTLKLKNINPDSIIISQNEFLSKRRKIEDSLWNHIDSDFTKDEEMISYGIIGSMNIERASVLNNILKDRSRN